MSTEFLKDMVPTLDLIVEAASSRFHSFPSFVLIVSLISDVIVISHF